MTKRFASVARRTLIALVALIGPIALVACGGGGGGGSSTSTLIQFPVALTPPDLKSTTPDNNETDLPTGIAVTAVFTATMNSATLNSTTFTVSGPGGAVAGTITTTPDSATFFPSTPLAVNTLYTAQISTAAKDSVGTSLAAARSWSFRTLGAAPVGRFAYVPNADSKSNTVSVYAVDAPSGRLRPAGFVKAGQRPISIAVDSNGRFAYSGNSASNDVSPFSVNALTGALTPIGSPVTRPRPVVSVIASPAGPFLFVIDSDGTAGALAAYRIDGITGALSLVNESTANGASAGMVSIDPSGSVLMIGLSPNKFAIYAINPISGALSIIPGTPITAPSKISSVALHPIGNFVYATLRDSNAVAVYSFDLINGALSNTLVPCTCQTGPTPVSIAIDPAGRFAFVGHSDNGGVPGGVSVYTINQRSGALTPVTGSPFAAGFLTTAVEVDPSGSYVYAVNTGGSSTNVSAYAINRSTGALSALGTVGTQLSPQAITFIKGTAPVQFVPKFVYVANQGSNNVSGYAISASTGALTAIPGSPFPAGASPQSVAIDPLGRFAYVSNDGVAAADGSVSAFAIGGNGALTAVGTTAASLAKPGTLTVDPTGRYVHVALKAATTAATSVATFSINANGSLTAQPGPLPQSPLPTLVDPAVAEPVAVAIAPSGLFAYVANRTSANAALFSVDTSGSASNGRFQSIQPSGSALLLSATGTAPNAIAIPPSGRAYVVNRDSGSITAYQLANNFAALTGSPFSTGGVGVGSTSIAIDPLGKFAFATNSAVNTIVGFGIDAVTGALAPIGVAAPAPGTPQAVAVEPSGRYAYVANGLGTVSVYSINATTGVLSAVGSPLAAGTNPVSIAATGVMQ